LGDNASQPVPMSADDQITPAVRAAKLLDRGPVPVPTRSWPERIRALLRRGLLLLARPQARHQREVDDAIVAGLERLERYTEQIKYLEDLVGELILTVESLRRASASAAGNAGAPDGDVASGALEGDARE
jgi:hypothetical protein